MGEKAESGEGLEYGVQVDLDKDKAYLHDSDGEMSEALPQEMVVAEELDVLEMSQAARALMTNRELSDEETTEISFGRRIAAGSAAGTPGAATPENPAAGFAPDGTLVALLADKGSYAKPVLVFAPDNVKRAPKQPTAEQQAGQ